MKKSFNLNNLLFALLFCQFGVKGWSQTAVALGGEIAVTCPATPTATWTTPPNGVTFSNLTRGSGVACASGNNGLNGSGFTSATAADGFTANAFYTVTLTADATHSFTLSSISWKTNLNGSGNSCSFLVQYRNDGGALTTFGNTQTLSGSGGATFIFSGTPVNVAAGKSLVLYATPFDANASNTTVQVVNATTISVAATPSLTTTTASSVTATTAVSGGNISADGAASVTARGVAYGTGAGPTIAGPKTTDGSGAGTFTSTLTSLTPNTQYFYRAYATNSVGTTYGNEGSFYTAPAAPVAAPASGVTAAMFNANWSSVTAATSYRLDVFNAPASEDFTDGNFTSAPAWSGSTSNYTISSAAPVPMGNAGNDGFYLASNASVGSSTLYTQSTENSEWNFSLASGSFSPSSSNTFGVVLMADNTLATIGSGFNGYYLKFGSNGANDKIELWKSTGTTKTKISDFPSSPIIASSGLTDGLNLRITRSSSGVFSLFYSTGFTYNAVPTTNGGTVTDNTYSSSAYFGVFTEFSNPANAKRIYIDNIVFGVFGSSISTDVNVGNVTTYAVSGLAASTTYLYRVRAVNSNGTSDNSNTISVQTCPPAPAAPGTISGPSAACPATTGLNYSVAQVVNATSYNWTVPADWTITSGQGTTNIVVNAGTSRQFGTISVNAQSCGATGASSTLAVYVAATWTGALGTNWTDAGNWTCGIVPLATDNAFVPATVNSPTLTANQTISGLIIDAGARVVLSGKRLTINGDVAGTGVLRGSKSSDLTVGGTGTGTIYFDQSTDSVRNQVDNLTINRFGNISLGNKLYVLSVFTLTQGTLNTNDSLVLRSTSTAGTARFAPVTSSTASVQGNVIVERYISSKRAYRFVTPSVVTTQTIQSAWMEGQHNTTTTSNSNTKPGYGTHITGAGGSSSGYDQTVTNNASLFIYDEGTQKYTNYPNTVTNGNLVNGKGYRLFVRGSRAVDLNNNAATPSATILRVAGTLKIGSVTFNSTTDPKLTTATGESGYSFVGNPYASPISWKTVTRSGLFATYYTWDAQVNTRGAFVNYSSFTGVNNNSSSNVNDTIQPGEGFFIQTSGANPSITFNESNKTDGNLPLFRTPAAITSLSVKLLLNTNAGTQNTADGTVAVFDDTYSSQIGDEDSYKLTNLDENIAIVENMTNLSIDGRPTIAQADTIHLNIWQYRQTSYFLKLDATNFAPGTTAFLKDAYLNAETKINLDDSTLVPFSITTDSASFAPDRFMIVFTPGSVLPVTVTDVKAYQKEKGIQVDWISRTETNIGGYEVEKSLNGRDFEKSGSVEATGNNTAVTSYGWFDATPAEGNNFYRVKVIEKSGALKYMQIVKVTIGKANSSMTVYPNPVKGSTISLHMTNMEKGKYTATLYNNLGQKMLSRQIEHIGGSANYSIATGRVMPKGTYRLTATNGETEMTATVVFE